MLLPANAIELPIFFQLKQWNNKEYHGQRHRDERQYEMKKCLNQNENENETKNKDEKTQKNRSHF